MNLFSINRANGPIWTMCAVAVFLSTQVQSAVSSHVVSYYCSLSDVLLRQESTSVNDGVFISDVHPGGKSFPRSEDEVVNRQAIEKVLIETHNCSSQVYECLRLVQHQLNYPDKEFYLVIPRIVELAKSYSVKGIDIFVQPSNLPSDSKKRPSSAQVVIWQLVDGERVPMKLTVEFGRGVVFIDGLKFGGRGVDYGESCSLQSRKGFFESVNIIYSRRT